MTGTDTLHAERIEETKDLLGLLRQIRADGEPGETCLLYDEHGDPYLLEQAISEVEADLAALRA